MRTRLPIVQNLLVPWSKGQSKKGVKSGCFLLADTQRKKINGGFHEVLNHRHDENDNEKQDYMSRLHKQTAISLERYQKTVVIGGDHSISAATVPAFFDRYRDRGYLVWVDAHPDIQLPQTSPSGNSHGMPVSTILGNIQTSFPRKYIPYANQISYLGIRDIDPDESLRIKHLEQTQGLQCFYGPDLLDFGADWPRLVTRKLDHMFKIHNYEAVYVSFDVDVLNDITGTGTPFSGGISGRDLSIFFNSLSNISNVVGMDIVEFNPELCQDTETGLLEANQIINIASNLL